MKITASQRKLIASLSSARRRREEKLFVAEGIRCLSELLPVFRLRYLVATSAWLEANGDRLAELTGNGLTDDRLLVARNDEMERMSTMTTPQGVLGVFEMPDATGGAADINPGELVLALDRVQDPGNLGTIVRTADWFGVRTILASSDTVDVYNPKVLQSTMGAIARVNVLYCDLVESLRTLVAKGIPVYGTFLDGKNLYKEKLDGGVVVMGNEGNGISPVVAELVTRRVTIPSYPEDNDTVESLNVGIATAVVLSYARMRAAAD